MLLFLSIMCCIFGQMNQCRNVPYKFDSHDKLMHWFRIHVLVRTRKLLVNSTWTRHVAIELLLIKKYISVLGVWYDVGVLQLYVLTVDDWQEEPFWYAIVKDFESYRRNAFNSLISTLIFNKYILLQTPKCIVLNDMLWTEHLKKYIYI